MLILRTQRLATVGETSYDRVTVVSPDDPDPWDGGVQRCPAVSMVLPFDLRQRCFWLADEARIGVAGAPVRGVPGGSMDVTGESDPELTARRELREELGFEAARWWLVACSAHGSPGRNDEKVHLWLAEGITVVGHGESDVQPIRLSLSELHDMIASYRRPVVAGEPLHDLKALALLQALRIMIDQSPDSAR